MKNKNNRRNRGFRPNGFQNNTRKMNENEKNNIPSDEEIKVSPEDFDNTESTAPEATSEEALSNEEEVKDAEIKSEEDEIATLKAALEKEKKEYLFLMADFDNFRKRSIKEKSEIIKNAGENVFKGLLPVVDDMERGLKASADATDVESVKEGLQLIYNKLKKYMEAHGVKEFDPADDSFDADRHEAISVVPVPEEDKKGKILDTVEKGYTINDKVLRHAKVVVGQ